MKRVVADLVTEAALIVAGPSEPLGLSPRGRKAWETLVEGLERKSIFNVDFKPAADTMNREFESVFHKLRPSYKEDRPMAATINSITESLFSLQSVNKIIRDYKKWIRKPALPRHDRDVKELPSGAVEKAKEILAALETWVQVLQLRKDIKPFIVKGRKPSGKPPKEIYRPPPSSMASLREVQKMLEKMVEAERKGIESRGYERIKKAMAAFFTKRSKKENTLSPYWFFKDNQPMASLAASVFEPATEGFRQLDLAETIRYKSDAEKTMRARAVRDAKYVTDTFVQKNMQKLTSIISEKVKVAPITKMDAGKTRGDDFAFQGEMEFEFGDGSGFVVRNQIVWSWSIYGRSYIRFPTTFHQVVFPDGSRKAKQSEKQMNEQWAKP